MTIVMFLIGGACMLALLIIAIVATLICFARFDDYQ